MHSQSRIASALEQERQLMYNGQLGGANRSQSNMSALKGKDKIMSEMLKNEINQSKYTVEKIKRGYSLFELEAIKKAHEESGKTMVIKQDGIR